MLQQANAHLHPQPVKGFSSTTVAVTSHGKTTVYAPTTGGADIALTFDDAHAVSNHDAMTALAELPIILSVSKLTSSGVHVDFNTHSPHLRMPDGTQIPVERFNGLYWVRLRTSPSSTSPTTRASVFDGRRLETKPTQTRS
jgi:hypothetical protein